MTSPPLSSAGTPSRSSSVTTRSSNSCRSPLTSCSTSKQTSRPLRPSSTTMRNPSSPTSATCTSHRSSRAATKRRAPASSPLPTRSIRSSPTAGWACPSSRLSCSSFTGSPWSASAHRRRTGRTTACSATAGTCSASAPPLTPMQLTNTPPQAKRSAATMSSTPKPKTSTQILLWPR